MATESESERIFDIERRYKDRILYETLVLQRINAVIFALDNYYPAIPPLQILCSILIPDIRSKVKDELVRLEQDYNKKISNREITRIQREEKNKRSVREIKRYFEKIYVMQSLQAIIDELDKHGLLIAKDRMIEMGGRF